MNQVLYWNAILLEASRRDHSRGYQMGQQGGPTATSRAMAIVHLAIHDAVAYVTLPGAAYLKKKYNVSMTKPGGAIMEDVIDGAAHTALSALYPKYQAYFDDSRGPSNVSGFNFGRDIALALLEMRKNDGSTLLGSAAPPPVAGAPTHRPDPFNPGQGELGARWGEVTHFVGPRKPLTVFPGYGGDNYRTNAHYQTDYDEVRDTGALARGPRTAEQETIGVYWGYDGAQGIGVPPRLYNQIARKIAIEKNLNLSKTAELFAQINVAMGDAAIDAWHYKYANNLWRPVVGIRHDASGKSDHFWAPKGAPQTNKLGAPPSTPAFPAYPSGHATFGAALFQTLRLRLAPNAAPMTVAEVMATETNDQPIANERFEFISDELDGRAVDTDGSIRTQHNRTLNSYARATYENAISRVYLGVHWRFDGLPRDADDNIGGVPLGLAIAEQVHTYFNGGPSLGGIA